MSVAQLSTIGSFCRTGSGTTPPRSAAAKYYGGPIPWVKSGELRETDIENTEETVTELALKETPLKLVPPGSLLVAMYGATVGRTGILRKQATTNQAICHIIPNEKVADTRYLFHALQYLQPTLVRRGVGGAQPNISQEIIRSIEVRLPALNEQRRIAAILDQANELRRKRRETLNRLKHLPPAVLEELLGNENAAKVQRLDELVRSDDRINYGVVQPGPEVEQGIPLVRVENVVDEDFAQSNLKRISPRIEARYARSRLRGDEILVACVGSVGAVALAQADQQGFNIARAVARIPLDPMKAERIFVAEALKTRKVQAYFKAETRAVAQPTLNIKQLCETRLPVPALPVQRAFAARVAEIDKVKTHYRAHLVKLDALFASLQDRAFRGEL